MENKKPIEMDLNEANKIAINKVKQKYPKAEVKRDGALFFCHEGLMDLGAGFSEYAAWKSAACNI